MAAELPLSLLSVSEMSIQCERIPYKFEQLRQLIADDGPKFVFGHMLIPHDPFVFDRNGRCTAGSNGEVKSNYTEQVAYANQEVIRFIDAVRGSAKRPVIILLQADEGPYPKRLENFLGFDWREATAEELHIKTRILNAYYFPNQDYQKLYPTISPVNSFRVVFGQYFGLELELLPDEIYAHRDVRHIYDFRRATERVQAAK